MVFLNYKRNNMNTFYTHREYLKTTLESFDYSKRVTCLEFGSGDGSSSIFNEFAKKHKNIEIHCFEHNEKWLNNMREKYQMENYVFSLVDWGKLDYNTFESDYYDLVFIDQGDWDSRIKTIDELKDKVKYFILHDYCYYNGFRGSVLKNGDREKALGIGENTFFYEKYNNDFDMIVKTELFPPTLILKNKNL